METGTSLTILLVDDDVEHVEMWSAYLAYEGFEIRATSAGAEALRILQAHPIDLVLLDVNLPDQDGFETLAEIRRLHSPEELPVIFATGRGKSHEIVHGFELGANDYITKPVSPDVLVARIRRQLRTLASASRIRDVARIEPGVIVEGRYRIESKIGEGGTGVVYRANQIGLHRQVALKFVTSVDEGAVARLRREGLSACRVNHDHAVRILDSRATSNGIPFLVMELLDGHALSTEIRRQGTLSPSRCLEIVRPICEVLSEAHEHGVIHRDIKPGNIFLHRPNGREMVKILDFGLAKIRDDLRQDQTQTLDGCLIGTPAYLAPERFVEVSYDNRVDVYSVGVMLYEMLSGRLPFATRSLSALIRSHLLEEPPRLRELGSKVSQQVEAVVSAALAKEPRKRPSAQELGSRFAAAVAAT